MLKNEVVFKLFTHMHIKLFNANCNLIATDKCFFGFWLFLFFGNNLYNILSEMLFNKNLLLICHVLAVIVGKVKQKKTIYI